MVHEQNNMASILMKYSTINKKIKKCLIITN